jgi:hypothetical protein
VLVLVGERGQANVLAESRMMIPDCRRRLESSLEALREAVVRFRIEMAMCILLFPCTRVVMLLCNYGSRFSRIGAWMKACVSLD